ncbi:MAG: aminotransferase class V-fold PLP-dependent enzyme [Deltaproteobacteria bacterium]|nr:aminotransferase class V-fold PLP-dependent enzyme [Deltaproteobacteria bacterium]
MTRAAIPTTGEDHGEILASMKSMRGQDADWKHGRTWSLVYFAGDAHHQLLQDSHNMFFAENALNPMAFKSIKRMEAEVIAMSASMLHGPDDACGTMTTGGTESILMAVKAARNRARARGPKTQRPEIVAPSTAHPALIKAAHYFGLHVRKIPVGPDYRADVRAMRKAMNKNTVLLFASAPQYPHGVIDPIDELGRLALEWGVPFHVDACIGGFVLPWIEKLGHALPTFDFRVPGVTSMSADLHKYGFAVKGASVVIYRDMSYLEHQFFVETDFPGGVYASPTMTGTRGGGPIAAAWAALHAVGEDGFMEHTRIAMDAAQRLQQGIVAIPELQLVGKPDATLVAWCARDRAVDIYAVADRLEDAGWSVDRQHRPACIHHTVTSNHATVVDEYLADLRDAVAFVKSHPEVSARGNAAMYGMMAKIPFRGMVKQGVVQVLRGMYGPDAATFDPTKVGQDDGVMGKVMDVVGPTLNKVLDQVDRMRDAVRSR